LIRSVSETDGNSPDGKRILAEEEYAFATINAFFTPRKKLKGRIFMKGSGITNTKRLVGTALFAALAYVTSFLEFRFSLQHRF